MHGVNCVLDFEAFIARNQRIPELHNNRKDSIPKNPKIIVKHPARTKRYRKAKP